MDDLDTANQAGADDTLAGTVETDTGAGNHDAGEPTLDAQGNPVGDNDQVIEDEFEEIERDGRKAKIPAWLKPELMMQADYTRKTQELAEARRAFEAERETLGKASQEELQARASLTLIDRQLANYAKVDWDAFYEEKPFEAPKAFAQFQRLKDARAQAVGFIQTKQQERTVQQQQETAKRLEEGAAELAKAIPNWSPQTAAKLLDFGQQHYGFSKEDLDGIDDPRLVKVLHAAFQWEEHQKQQRRAQGHAAAQTARPAEKVGGAAPKPGLDDRLSAEEWLRRRNEQLRKRG